MAEGNADSYIDQIRGKNREATKVERREQRDLVINKRRGILGEISKCRKKSIKTEQVVFATNKIKHKGKVTEEDLKFLNKAFLQNEVYISTFLNTEGALHAIVRELSGVSAGVTQLAAVECIINLSCGNPKACFKIAKSAGPYLITHLQGMNVYLKNASIWALGNLLGSDLKTWSLLNSQGVLSLLLDSVSVVELQQNSVAALKHYLHIGYDELPSSDMKLIANALVDSKVASSDALWILYLLSCSKNCDEELIPVVITCIDILTKANENHITVITPAIRIVSNLISEDTGKIADEVVNDFEKICFIFENLTNYNQNGEEFVKKEFIWLIGNLMNHPSQLIKDKMKLQSERIKLLLLLYNSSEQFFK